MMIRGLSVRADRSTCEAEIMTSGAVTTENVNKINTHPSGRFMTACICRLNPFRLLYGYIRTKMVTRCDFRTDISVHGLCDRNMGLLPASKRHFTVSPHEVFT